MIRQTYESELDIANLGRLSWDKNVQTVVYGDLDVSDAEDSPTSSKISPIIPVVKMQMVDDDISTQQSET